MSIIDEALNKTQQSLNNSNTNSNNQEKNKHTHTNRWPSIKKTLAVKPIIITSSAFVITLLFVFFIHRNEINFSKSLANLHNPFSQNQSEDTNLKLNGIFKANGKYSAMINNNLYSINDAVDDYQITNISSTEVTLSNTTNNRKTYLHLIS